MPDNIINSFANKTDKSVGEIERLWKKAEIIVKSEYNINKEDESYYPLVVGVLKKSLGFKSEEFSIGVGDLTDVPVGGPSMGIRINKSKKNKNKRKKPKTFLEYLKRHI